MAAARTPGARFIASSTKPVDLMKLQHLRRGAAVAVANAVYNATGVRVRDYPVTLGKLLARMPALG